MLKEIFKKKICISIPIFIGIILILVIAGGIYILKIESEVSVVCGTTASDCETYCNNPCSLFNRSGFDAPFRATPDDPICLCSPLGD